MLPKLSYPTFETTIPSTGESVKYRPFTTGEYKILLTAVNFKDHTNLVETFKSLIEMCTFGEVDTGKLALFDVTFLYLKIKGASTGSLNNVKYKCNHINENNEVCGAIATVSINTDGARVIMPTNSNKVIIVDEANGIGVKLRYPSFEKMMKQVNTTDLNRFSEEFVLDCIDSVFDANSVYLPDKDFTRDELKEFINAFPGAAVGKIVEFINEMPDVEMDIKIRCPKCGSIDVVTLRGLDDFLE